MKAALIGTIAGICTTAAFLPQVIKVCRTKHTSGISLSMYVVFSSGVFLWMWYGAMVKSLPILAANAVTFILSIYILIMKVRHK